MKYLLGDILVCANITEYHTLQLKQLTFIFHSCGGWEVQDQGSGQGRFHSKASSLGL